MSAEEINSTKFLRWLRRYAEKQGFGLNPDTPHVERIIEGLFSNKAKFGDMYCPCRAARDAKTICPCAYHKDEIKDMGHCLCGLFVTKKS